VICTEALCTLHDYRINAWGVCLRADALRRSGANTAERSDVDLGDSLRQLAEVLERLESAEQPQFAQRYAPPYTPSGRDQPRKPQPQKGGTPLPP